MAAIACRAAHAERALDRPWLELGRDRGRGAALAADFKPLTDLRASSAYRLQAAGNLLRRFYLEHRSRASGAAHQRRFAR